VTDQPEMFDPATPDTGAHSAGWTDAERRYVDRKLLESATEEDDAGRRRLPNLRSQVRGAALQIDRSIDEIVDALEHATPTRPPQPGVRAGRGGSGPSDPTNDVTAATAGAVERACHQFGLPDDLRIDPRGRERPLGLLWVTWDLHQTLATWISDRTVELLDPRGETYNLAASNEHRTVVVYDQALQLVTRDGLCGTPWTSRHLVVHIRNAGLIAHALTGDIAGAWEDAAHPRAGQTGMDTPGLVQTVTDLRALARGYDHLAGSLRHWSSTSHPRAGIRPPTCNCGPDCCPNGCDDLPRTGRRLSERCKRARTRRAS
jgi:hypothetical protein